MREWRGTEEFEEEGGGFIIRDAIGRGVALDRTILISLGDGLDILGGECGLWVMGDVFLEGGDGAVEEEVEDGCEDEEDDHESQGPSSFGRGAGADTEEADEADFREIDAGCELVDGFGERATLRVDCDSVHGVEKVVAEGEIEEREGDGGEGEHEGRDT